MASRSLLRPSTTPSDIREVILQLPRPALIDLVEAIIDHLDALDGEDDLEPEEDVQAEDYGGAL
jgi:hypothetical protein